MNVLRMVVFVGDTHFGRKTPEFNKELASVRMKDFYRSVRRAKSEFEYHNRRYNRGKDRKIKMSLVLLGDIVDGEDKYAKQVYEQDMDVNEQIDFAVKHLLPLVNLSDSVYAIIGNHSHRHDSNTDFDWMTYELLESKAKRTVRFYKYRELEQIVKIDNLKMLISHPKGVRMYMNIPFYGIATRTLRLKSVHNFKVAVYAHFHTSYYFNLNGIDIYGNGTLLKGDELSKRIGLVPSNKFLILLLNNNNNVIRSRWVDV